MKYKFTEIFDIPTLQKLCQSFTEIHGTVTALLDLDGEVHVSTGWQDICTKFHRVNPGTAQRCTESDTILAGQLAQGESYNVYRCKNGLVDVAVPVMIGGEHVANFFTGQFLFDAPDVGYFSKQAKEFGIDEIPYVDALNHVPIFTEDQVKRTMKFLVMLTEIVGEMGRKKIDDLRKQESRRLELERLVAERTEELEFALQRAEAANASQRQFIASMSHELRTPLTAIQGYCELMEREMQSDELKRLLKSIRAASDNQLHLVNDLLDTAKIGAGKFDLDIKPFSLTEIYTNLRDLIGIKASDKGLALDIRVPDIPTTVLLGDGNRLTQILLNLLSNAVKFTNEGGVSIETHVEQSVLVIAVRDTGIGFDQDDAERLFEAFTQSDHTISTRFGGTGLGLSISRSLAELMGGTLDAEGRRGSGACFVLRIPYLPHAEPAAELVRGTPSSQGKIAASVLVAEDQEILQILITRMLESYGARVTVVDNGQDALDRAANENFDLIFMDMQMPVMDGHDATRLLRERGIRTPVIALTAATTPDDRQAFEDAGCDEFLTKPYAMEDIYSMLLRYAPYAQQSRYQSSISPADGGRHVVAH